LAYSAETTADGGLEIDVWDNNIPGHPESIFVEPNGTWTYDAPAADNLFPGDYSMSGASGYTSGKLAVLPLYDPTGLTFYPAFAGDNSGGVGTGSLVDVGAGVTISGITDAGNDPVDVEPVPADGSTPDNGEILDFPSDGGQVMLSGTDPSLDVRGANTFMTADAAGDTAGLMVSEDDQAGSITGSGAPVALSVGRSNQVAQSTGVGGLTYGSDGTITTTDDSSNATVDVEFESNGTLATATLSSGPTTPGGSMTFTPSEISAAETGATTSPVTTTPTGTSPKSGAGTIGLARSARVTKAGVAQLQLRCTGSPGDTCNGHLTLNVTVTKTTRRTVHGHERRVVIRQQIVIGSGTFDLEVKAPAVASAATVPSTTLDIQLSGRARALLREARDAELTALARALSAGQTIPLGKLSLHAPRAGPGRTRG
jgi:hypothetical protein